MADGLAHGKRVRREDLFRDDVSEAEAEDRRGEEGDEAGDNEVSAAARAALDAYMARTLGQDFGIPPTPTNEKNDASEARPPLRQQQPVKETTAAKNTGSDESSDDGDDSDNDDDADPPVRAAAADKGATEFAFRLFASSRGPSTTAAAAAGSSASSATVTGTETERQALPSGMATIVLLPDEIDDDDVYNGLGAASAAAGGLLNAPRPLSFYIPPEPTAAEQACYAASAVRGEDVRAHARADHRDAWGWERPWRARTAVRGLSRDALLALLANAVPDPATTPQKRDLARALRTAANRVPAWAAAAAAAEGDTTGSETNSTPPPRHRRPGKNRRRTLHRRAQAQREKEAAAAAAKQSKEEHLLEKKKRLNRTKKLRRREKKRTTATPGSEVSVVGSDP